MVVSSLQSFRHLPSGFVSVASEALADEAILDQAGEHVNAARASPLTDPRMLALRYDGSLRLLEQIADCSFQDPETSLQVGVLLLQGSDLSILVLH